MIRNILSLAAAVMLLFTFAACGNSSSSGTSNAAVTTTASSSTDAGSKSGDSTSAQTVTGKVISVEGSTITIDTINMPTGGPSGLGGNNNSGPSQQSGTASSSTMPEGGQNGPGPQNGGQPPMTSDGSASQPSGQVPANGGGPRQDGGFSGFETTGETKTITIETDTVITKNAHMGVKGDSQSDSSGTSNSQTMTLSDIAVGDIITVTYSDSKVASIRVMQLGSNDGSTTAATATAAATAGTSDSTASSSN